MSDKIITFKQGIPGFEQLTKFIIQESEHEKFYYLQSVEDESVGFIIIDPYVYDSTYAPTISESYFEQLGGGGDDLFVIYAILTLGNTLAESTINLQAPLLIQTETKQGVQVITEDEKYQTKTKIEIDAL